MILYKRTFPFQKVFRRVASVILHVLALLLAGVQSGQAAETFGKIRIDTIVVCPAIFQHEMQRWIAHRESQGHGIVMVQPSKTAFDLQIRIRQLAKKYPVRYLVLVGDCYGRPLYRSQSLPIVPRGQVKAKVNVKFGSESMICTDNLYADLDDDLIPELAVGRLSVDSNAELRTVVGKILEYEKNPPPGPWRSKINLVAGVGGFGTVTDRVIETAARQLILRGIPREFETKLTCASWRSPYCPDPRYFHDVTVNSLNEGCLFWVYFGHGHIHRLDHVETPVSRFQILDVTHKQKLRAHRGMPIAMLLACYTGAMDSLDDCLAEEMLEAEGGPVAVFAGSRVTMPYAMSILSHEMLVEFFSGDSQTLGDLILRSKRNMIEPRQNERDPTRAAIEGLAGILSPTRDLLAEERLEHVQLFNLLGDPLLKLPKSSSLHLDVPPNASLGHTIQITGSSPLSGKLSIELNYDRAKLPFKPQDRKEFEWTTEFLARLQLEYLSANYKTVAAHSKEIEGGEFTISLAIPAHLKKGKFQVRAFLENQQAFAVGCSDIRIR